MTTLYRWMADIMSGCYAATHNYALAIALLTLATVAITTPLTWKASRGMIAMQALQPEMKKIQTKYKGDREAMNREMQKLYQEAGINPLAGCLPLLPQMVVFYILYHTISNLSHRLPTNRLGAHCPTPTHGAVQVAQTAGKYTCSDPTNLSTHSLLYHNLVNAGGHMNVFGFDLTLGVRTAHGGALVGCLILVALVVGAQYWQTRQVNRRNPSAAANPQAQMMQRIFPIFFGLISINIQAGVNVYFFVSALCRIAQQSLMFRYDPVLRRQLHLARTGKTIDLPPRSAKSGGGLFGALLGGAPNPGGPSGGNRPSGGSPGQGGGSPAPPRSGGLARLLGLADPDPANQAPSGGRSSLGRFLDGGSDGGAPRPGGTLKDRAGGSPPGGSTGAKGAASNGSSSGNGNGSGSYNSRNRRGAPPPAKHQDRNRSRSKKSRRSR